MEVPSPQHAAATEYRGNEKEATLVAPTSEQEIRSRSNQADSDGSQKPWLHPDEDAKGQHSTPPARWNFLNGGREGQRAFLTATALLPDSQKPLTRARDV